MPEYIEREALRDKLLNISIDISNLYNCGILEGLDRATKRLNEQPAADVTPVRHGRWELHYEVINGELIPSDKKHVCSECKDIWETSSKLNYCPDCGAKMDGGAD